MHRQYYEELRNMREDMEKWVNTNPRLARLCLAQYNDQRAKVARFDVNEFMEFVFLDRKQKTVKQAPHHKRMQHMANLYDRLIVWGFVESGKSVQLAYGRTLWRIGRDPNLQIAIVGAAAKNQSARISEVLMDYIRRNERLRKVFPGLRPGRPWGVTAFSVDRPVYSRDPTVQATSIETGSLQGSRIDLLLIDDIITHLNSLTQENRDKIYAQLMSTTFLGRLTEHSQVLWLGNAVHPEDAMHRMAKNPRWKMMRQPVLTPGGESVWPSQWSTKRIEAKRVELGPDEFARQMLCIARDDSAGRFKRDWINRCLERGLYKKMLHTLGTVPPGWGVYTGVDLGHRKQAGADVTSLMTIAVNQKEEREVICLESGRWAGNEIVERIMNTHDRYNSIVYVENNGAQQHVIDFVQDISAVPVLAAFTGKNKIHPDNGIEGMAVEVSNAKWIIPSLPGNIAATEELETWISEMIYYDPKAHAGDRLMASWIAREGSRAWKKRPKGGVGRLDTVSR
jgi:hypothetical protein